MSVKDYLQSVLEQTLDKVALDQTVIDSEYDELEQVPPAPGQSWDQHDAMVSSGLCKKACKNPQKNRYRNLYPYDKSIVSLQDPEQYINASWVSVLPWHPERKFILTMAPLHPSECGQDSSEEDDDEDVDGLPWDMLSKKPLLNTCPDFWQLIWDTQSKIIVMLCKADLFEYFPVNEGQTVNHDQFTIKTTNCLEESSEICERDFELILGQECRTIKHLQFKDWPNFGVPDAVRPIAEFIKLVHSKAEALKTQDPELVIHCSAGIGRTGTFLTAYGAYSHFLRLKADVEDKPEPLTLLPAVKALRLTRHPWMVEGRRQYRLAYDISIQHLKELSTFN
jgi:protein tyrosine phosphatase